MEYACMMSYINKTVMALWEYEMQVIWTNTKPIHSHTNTNTSKMRILIIYNYTLRLLISYGEYIPKILNNLVS